MKQFLFILLAVLLLAGCKSRPPQRQVPIVEKEQIRERQVPVAIPADSMTLKALFECDSLNNVVLKQMSDNATAAWQTAFEFYNGLFSLKIKQPPDTVFVPVVDTTRYKEIPVEVPVPYEVEKPVYIPKDLSTWQKIRLTLGDIFMIVLGVGLLTFILKWKQLF